MLAEVLTGSKTLRNLILALLLWFSSVTQAADTGSSSNFFYLKKLDETRQFVSRSSIATRDGFEDTFFGYIDAGLRWKTSAQWYLETAYRQAWLNLPGGSRREYRPMLDLGYRTNFEEWQFINRSRLELRYFEGDAEDRIRYRNESIWNGSRGTMPGDQTPYISQEFFYDITDSEFNENWLTLGISGSISKSVNWKLGYRLQSRKPGDDWENRHLLVVGISLLDFE